MPEPLQDADALEVLKERCEYIYRRILPAVGATAVLSLLLSAFLWPSSPTELIVFWQTAILLIAAGYWALALAYQRSGDSREHPQPWIRRAAFGAAALGAVWGFATAVFFPGGDYQQVFIAFVVALVTAGGLPMFSTVWWIYALYAAGVMIPFNGVLFAYGTDFFHLLGAAVPLLYIANVATAYQLGKAFSSAYGLRSAYERLSADNAATQAQLGEQLDSLLEAHREVQAFGRKLALFSERAPIAVFEVDPRATSGADRGVRGGPARHDPRHESGGREPVRLRGAGDGGTKLHQHAAQSGRPRGHRQVVGRAGGARPAGHRGRRALPAARRPGARLRVDDDAARRRRQPGHLGHPAGPRHHAAARGRAHAKRVHLHLEPRAAHAAHFDHRLAAAVARRGDRRGLQGAGRDGRDRREEQPAPARPDQRGAGHREDRVGAADAGARAHAARCAAGRVAAAQPGLRRPLSRQPRAARGGPPGRRAGGPKAPDAGDDQPAVERRQVLAAEQRRRRDRRAEGGGGARGGERPGSGHSRGFSRPHLRPLRAGRFGRFARQGRYRPGARHLQAAGGNDAGAHRLRGPRRRRHYVLFRAARHAAGRDRRQGGPPGASHRARHRRCRVPLDGPRERRLSRRRRARRERLA